MASLASASAAWVKKQAESTLKAGRTLANDTAAAASTTLKATTSHLPGMKRQTRPLAFRVEITIHALEHFPGSGQLYVKWRDTQRTSKHKLGRTVAAPIDEVAAGISTASHMIVKEAADASGKVASGISSASSKIVDAVSDAVRSAGGGGAAAAAPSPSALRTSLDAPSSPKAPGVEGGGAFKDDSTAAAAAAPLSQAHQKGGYTDKAWVDGQHSAVWNTELILENARFAVDTETNIVQPYTLHLSVRQVVPATGGHRKVGVADINLAEFLASSTGLGRVYLLRRSAVNASLRISVKALQLEGDPMFCCPKGTGPLSAVPDACSGPLSRLDLGGAASGGESSDGGRWSDSRRRFSSYDTISDSDDEGSRPPPLPTRRSNSSSSSA